MWCCVCKFMHFFLIWMILDTLWKCYLFLLSFVLPSALIVPNLEQRCNLRKGMCERGSHSRATIGAFLDSVLQVIAVMFVCRILCVPPTTPPFPPLFSGSPQSQSLLQGTLLQSLFLLPTSTRTTLRGIETGTQP